MSLNSHAGPHNGKGDVVETVQTLTNDDGIAVVMATGNNAAVRCMPTSSFLPMMM